MRARIPTVKEGKPKVLRLSARRAERLGPRKNPLRDYLKNYDLYLILLLPVAYIIIFRYIPLYGNKIAFSKFSFTDGIMGSPWVGLYQFKKFLNSYQFWRVFNNTISLSVYSLAVNFPVPILFALSLNNAANRVFKKSVQTIVYAPHFISTTVMVGMILQFLHPRVGFVNIIITSLGMEPVEFMSNPAYFKTVFVMTDVWQHTGWGTIIYLASLASIDQNTYDAAIVDGASRLQRTYYIDIPGILPTALIILIMSTGDILNISFEKVFLMQNDLNLRASEVIQTHVYKTGIATSLPDYSYATAIGLLNSVVSLVLIVIVNGIVRRYSEHSLW